MYFLILKINPEPWAIGDVGIHRKGGKVEAHVGRNVQLSAYQEAIRDEAEYYLGDNRIPGTPFEVPVRLEFYLWRQQIVYESVSGKQVQKHRVDATNMQKALEDALQGVVYKNDTQVVDIHTVVMEQGPEVEPLIVVGVTPTMGPYFSQLPDEIRFDVQNLLAGNPDLFHADQPIQMSEEF